MKHRHRNTDPKIGRGGGRKAGQEPKENNQKHRKPRKAQGPYPDLRGFCTKALPPGPWGRPEGARLRQKPEVFELLHTPPPPLGPLKAHIGALSKPLP